MNATEHTNQELLAALSRLEKNLETPIVPGELADWTDSVRESQAEVQELLQREITNRHPRLLHDIEQEDMGLAVRVEDLKKKDQELWQECRDLRAAMDRFAEQAERAEPHEAKLQSRTEQLTSRALQFVLQARTQETALTTWYLESLNRDRGTVD